MRCVLLGPPGAGKGTIAQTLSTCRQAPQIATGDLLRAEVEAQTPLGKDVQRYLDAGGSQNRYQRVGQKARPMARKTGGRVYRGLEKG